MIVCENPKHSIKLLNKLGIKKKLISLHDYNEKLVIQRLSNHMANKKIILISDAGSPLISDPGFKLVRYYIEKGVKVTSVPGPSSIIPAGQLSGIPINQFYFAGFFPKSKKQMDEFLNEIKIINKTCIFFVSTHKIKECLDLLEFEFQDRLISLSKELTKLNEKVFVGSVNEIKEKITNQELNLKGEFVITVEGKTRNKMISTNLEDHNEEIYKLLKKFSLTDVVEIVHKLTGITKNKVYKWVLSLKKS